jgi:hypothetical protein
MISATIRSATLKSCRPNAGQDITLKTALCDL